MIATHSFKTRGHAAESAVFACALFLMSLTAPAAAQFDPTFMEDRVVRVIIDSGGKKSAASGFLWLRPDQIVTSLHAIPAGSSIQVWCRGAWQEASVYQVLKYADLALLKTATNLGSCRPFQNASEQKPAPNADLHTLGFHAGAETGGSRRFSKQHAFGRETLAGLIGDPGVLQKLADFGMPSVDLEIYYVQGGLLPGFSGAPVVDSSRQLIGIVDGGLDKGQSGYNWVIPARHLRDLLASAPTSTSPSTAAGSASLFSYGYVGAVENAIIEYDQRQWHYRWVKTKTKSLADLIRTSNSVDLAEIRSFLREHESVFGSGAEERLQFDIYEDQDKQLIIALPVGQALRLKNPVPGYRWLVSEANDVADGHIQFEQLEWSITPPGGGAPVSARDPDYFDAAIAEILRDCNQPGESRCQQAADSRKDITFPSGEKILKVGFNVFPEAPDGLTSYDFYSFAVRPDHDVAFRAYGRIYPGRDGIFECVDNPHIPECLNSKAAFTQLKQMLAVALISPRVNYRPRPPMNLSIE